MITKKYFMKIILSFILFTLFLFSSCDEDNPIEIPDSTITAKEQIQKVLQKARTDFAPDAKFAAIYGRNVSTSGEIDLLNTSSLNAFVYVVQSNAQHRNEFYIPVYQSDPVKSPINFTTMLSFIKDSTAGNIVGSALGVLATVTISESANYDDSPAAVNKALQNGGSQFIQQNAGTKIDMFLLPSKAIDSLSVTNSADWIINFYGNTSSLVLWLNTATGEVINLSEL